MAAAAGPGTVAANGSGHGDLAPDLDFDFDLDLDLDRDRSSYDRHYYYHHRHHQHHNHHDHHHYQQYHPGPSLRNSRHAWHQASAAVPAPQTTTTPPCPPPDSASSAVRPASQRDAGVDTAAVSPTSCSAIPRHADHHQQQKQQQRSQLRLPLSTSYESSSSELAGVGSSSTEASSRQSLLSTSPSHLDEPLQYAHTVDSSGHKPSPRSAQVPAFESATLPSYNYGQAYAGPATCWDHAPMHNTALTPHGIAAYSPDNQYYNEQPIRIWASGSPYPASHQHPYLQKPLLAVVPARAVALPSAPFHSANEVHNRDFYSHQHHHRKHQRRHSSSYYRTPVDPNRPASLHSDPIGASLALCIPRPAVLASPASAPIQHMQLPRSSSSSLQSSPRTPSKPFVPATYSPVEQPASEAASGHRGEQHHQQLNRNAPALQLQPQQHKGQKEQQQQLSGRSTPPRAALTMSLSSEAIRSNLSDCEKSIQGEEPHMIAVQSACRAVVYLSLLALPVTIGLAIYALLVALFSCVTAPFAMCLKSQLSLSRATHNRLAGPLQFHLRCLFGPAYVDAQGFLPDDEPSSAASLLATHLLSPILALPFAFAAIVTGSMWALSASVYDDTVAGDGGNGDGTVQERRWSGRVVFAWARWLERGRGEISKSPIHHRRAAASARTPTSIPFTPNLAASTIVATGKAGGGTSTTTPRSRPTTAIVVPPPASPRSHDSATAAEAVPAFGADGTSTSNTSSSTTTTKETM